MAAALIVIGALILVGFTAVISLPAAAAVAGGLILLAGVDLGRRS